MNSIAWNDVLAPLKRLETNPDGTDEAKNECFHNHKNVDAMFVFEQEKRKGREVADMCCILILSRYCTYIK